jgi:hypothetical protein
MTVPLGYVTGMVPRPEADLLSAAGREQERNTAQTSSAGPRTHSQPIVRIIKVGN